MHLKFFTYKLFISLILILSVGVAFVSCNSDGDDEPLNPGTPSTHRVTLSAVDYRPAPGQFVNEMPRYDDGDTPESMNAKALELLNRGSLVSLGALGGEITLTLAEPIFHDANREADFRILGNSYITGVIGDITYGSSEPGIVWVMMDANGNGLPDDTWYRFVGDMSDQIDYFTITYTPAVNPTSQAWVDWSTDTGQRGSLTCNTAYHAHSYFPMWLYDDVDNARFTVSAYALPPNGFLESSSGLYRQICYRGFADSFPNNDPRSAFSLQDAVDINGRPANINRIDFIRITTAVIDSNGPLGEASTEIGGVEALF